MPNSCINTTGSWNNRALVFSVQNNCRAIYALAHGLKQTTRQQTPPHGCKQFQQFAEQKVCALTSVLTMLSVSFRLAAMFLRSCSKTHGCHQDARLTSPLRLHQHNTPQARTLANCRTACALMSCDKSTHLEDCCHAVLHLLQADGCIVVLRQHGHNTQLQHSQRRRTQPPTPCWIAYQMEGASDSPALLTTIVPLSAWRLLNASSFLSLCPLSPVICAAVPCQNKRRQSQRSPWMQRTG